MEKPVNFANAQERADWIIANADYFTAFRMMGRRRQRIEAPTLEQVRAEARALLAEDNSKPLLIYAVNGVNDTYVETVKA